MQRCVRFCFCRYRLRAGSHRLSMEQQPHGRIFAGTSGWAYPTWKPLFYPKNVPARRFLEHYSSRLSSVEVNYTFRALPKADQLRGWLDAVAAGGRDSTNFRFSFKAPETITHRRRLRDCADALDRFLASLLPVQEAGMLGCILFQLPPNFKADVPRLAAFLASPEFAAAPRIAFEFRHASWFSDELYALLRGHNAALCVAESDDLKTPEIHTARDFAVFRLRMAGGYSEGSIAQHASSFRQIASGTDGESPRDVFIYYKHEDEPAGPLAAEALLHRLEDAG